MTEGAARETHLTVAHAKVPIPIEAGAPLAGTITRRGRFAGYVRDGLFARALHLRAGDRSAVLACADLLVVPAALHRSVAERAGIPPADLVISATHTHSSLGGYWRVGRRGEILMGGYADAYFERVCAALAEAVSGARRGAGERATVTAARAAADGVSRNRRNPGGPVDAELLLVRFAPERGAPIDLVNFGAHPIAVLEHEPQAASADFPGALCARLESRGVRPMFFQGAVGGLDAVAGPRLDGASDPLERVAARLESAYERAVEALEPVSASSVAVTRVDVPIQIVCCRVLPERFPLSRFGELALFPLRRWMRRMGEEALDGESCAGLSLLTLGDVALLGAPCDLGVNVALELKRVLARAGVRFPLIGSHCNGYVGYAHRAGDYDYVPAGSERFITLYENAMSLGGWRLGEEMIDRVARVLGV